MKSPRDRALEWFLTKWAVAGGPLQRRRYQLVNQPAVSVELAEISNRNLYTTPASAQIIMESFGFQRGVKLSERSSMWSFPKQPPKRGVYFNEDSTQPDGFVMSLIAMHQACVRAADADSDDWE